MNQKSMAWLAALLLIFACDLPGFRPAESTQQITPTREIEILPEAAPACISSEPAQRDIDRALQFTGGLFDTPEWERSYTVMSGRVGVTWLNNSVGAVAYLEALIFPCGYEEPDLDQYFNDETWDVIFENYDGHEIVLECETNSGLRLYEVEAANQGFDYDIRYWVRNDTDTRVITMMMTFPVDAEDFLDEYASRLFPALSNCSSRR
jgi:hypothetical protein